MQIKLTIQEKLRDLRSERNLTLEQLAEKTGLSKSALGNYESNDFKDISPFAIVKLSKFYGVSTDYLLGLTENKAREGGDIVKTVGVDEVAKWEAVSHNYGAGLGFGKVFKALIELF